MIDRCELAKVAVILSGAKSMGLQVWAWRLVVSDDLFFVI
jgi:hypothetical protein